MSRSACLSAFRARITREKSRLVKRGERVGIDFRNRSFPGARCACARDVCVLVAINRLHTSRPRDADVLEFLARAPFRREMDYAITRILHRRGISYRRGYAFRDPE